MGEWVDEWIGMTFRPSVEGRKYFMGLEVSGIETVPSCSVSFCVLLSRVLPVHCDVFGVKYIKVCWFV